MILTTTNTIEGSIIKEYKGIVTGTSTATKTSFSFKHEKNMNMSNDVINKAQEEAFQKLQDHAKVLNANAIVGISIDFETPEGSYFFVSVVGTAVIIE